MIKTILDMSLNDWHMRPRKCKSQELTALATFALGEWRPRLV